MWMPMKVPFRLMAVLLLLIFPSHAILGCSIVTGINQSIRITSNVPGAEIHIDGIPYGVTSEGKPVVAKLKKSKQHYVTASKKGYASSTLSVHPTVSALGILDIIGAAIFILPIITIATGQAFELEPEALHLVLDEDHPR